MDKLYRLVINRIHGRSFPILKLHLFYMYLLPYLFFNLVIVPDLLGSQWQECKPCEHLSVYPTFYNLPLLSFCTARRRCSGFDNEGIRMVSVNFFLKPLRHCWYPSKSDWAMKWSPQMTDVSTPRFQCFRVDDTNLSHFFLTAWSGLMGTRAETNNCWWCCTHRQHTYEPYFLVFLMWRHIRSLEARFTERAEDLTDYNFLILNQQNTVNILFLYVVF